MREPIIASTVRFLFSILVALTLVAPVHATVPSALGTYSGSGINTESGCIGAESGSFTSYGACRGASASESAVPMSICLRINPLSLERPSDRQILLTKRKF